LSTKSGVMVFNRFYGVLITRKALSSKLGGWDVKAAMNSIGAL
jgi:hypothetical protein